jgi:L-fucose isomerase-like protein
LKIFIAAYNDISDEKISKAKSELLGRFHSQEGIQFVDKEPDVIWFLTGGSEHNALGQIEPQKRYCFIATQNENAWSAATEVKALLNEKGVITKIFNLDLIETLESLHVFLNHQNKFATSRLALIGNPENWLVASVPDYELLKEVLDIEIIQYNWDDVLALPDTSSDDTFNRYFADYKFDTLNESGLLYNKLNYLIERDKLSAFTVACFNLISQYSYSACLPLAVFNSRNIPAICEGDLCAAAGMIVLSRLVGIVPWMANLNYIDREAAIFSHCTAPVNMTDDFEIDTHFESGKASALKAIMKKGPVTVFRIDHQLEYCSLSLGEIVESGELIDGCRTQAKVKLLSKDLFLLREFPLGNHHLLVSGNHTDILAEYFTNKGFRIV